MIAQSSATSVLLDGGTTADAAAALAAEYGATTEDLVQRFDAVMAEQLAALRVPGALDRTVEHPLGSVLINDMLNYRIVDVLVHTWDLAESIGVAVVLDEPVARRAWDGLQPLAPMIAQLGVFGSGPSGTVGEPRRSRLGFSTSSVDVPATDTVRTRLPRARRTPTGRPSHAEPFGRRLTCGH